jgi:cytochrome c556
MKASTVALALAIAVAAGGIGAIPAAAQDALTTIGKRQDVMKGQGKALGAIRAFLEDKGDLAAAQAAGAGLLQSLPAIPSLFPQKTSLVEFPGKTRAKPEIWVQWDKFNAAVTAATAQAQALNTALKAGDKAAISAALGNLARDVPGTTPTPGGCGTCHASFRGPQT